MLASALCLCSVRDGQEVDRDQPLPAQNDGRWCWCVPFLLSSSRYTMLTVLPSLIAIPADVSRLPVLRVAQSQADLGRGNKQGPRLLAQLPKRVIVSISYTRTRRVRGLTLLAVGGADLLALSTFLRSFAACTFDIIRIRHRRATRSLCELPSGGSLRIFTVDVLFTFATRSITARAVPLSLF